MAKCLLKYTRSPEGERNAIRGYLRYYINY